MVVTARATMLNIYRLAAAEAAMITYDLGSSCGFCGDKGNHLDDCGMVAWLRKGVELNCLTCDSNENIEYVWHQWVCQVCKDKELGL